MLKNIWASVVFLNQTKKFVSEPLVISEDCEVVIESSYIFHLTNENVSDIYKELVTNTVKRVTFHDFEDQVKIKQQSFYKEKS